ncbi:MAG: 50S ribosomal protein L23 [Simkaniaceae bacterium]|nr:50S ribosomal protein L23 [Simkaniaceae bacterium]
MTKKNAYSVIKSRYMTEKANVLQNLHTAKSNKSLAKCDEPKYVFLVDKNANKTQIAQALEEIYKDKKIKVKAVNTINVKPKARRVRGRLGKTAMKKKAIVTLAAGDMIDDQV